MLAVAVPCPPIQDYLVSKDIVAVLTFNVAPGINLSSDDPDAHAQSSLYTSLSHIILCLSTCSDRTKQSLVKNGLVSKLVHFVSPRSPVYRYTTDDKSNFKRLVRWKALYGRVSPISCDKTQALFQTMQCHSLGLDEKHAADFKMSRDYSELELCRDTSRPGTSIADEMIRGGLVWKQPESDSSAQVKDGDLGWVDVTVTAVVDVDHVWAHVGKDATKRCDAIGNTIAAVPEQQRQYYTLPPRASEYT